MTLGITWNSNALDTICSCMQPAFRDCSKNMSAISTITEHAVYELFFGFGWLDFAREVPQHAETARPHGLLQPQEQAKTWGNQCLLVRENQIEPIRGFFWGRTDWPLRMGSDMSRVATCGPAMSYELWVMSHELLWIMNMSPLWSMIWTRAKTVSHGMSHHRIMNREISWITRSKSCTAVMKWYLIHVKHK